MQMRSSGAHGALLSRGCSSHSKELDPLREGMLVPRESHHLPQAVGATEGQSALEHLAELCSLLPLLAASIGGREIPDFQHHQGFPPPACEYPRKRGKG